LLVRMGCDSADATWCTTFNRHVGWVGALAVLPSLNQALQITPATPSAHVILRMASASGFSGAIKARFGPGCVALWGLSLWITTKTLVCEIRPITSTVWSPGASGHDVRFGFGG
jgi:hypothetical protein